MLTTIGSVVAESRGNICFVLNYLCSWYRLIYFLEEMLTTIGSVVAESRGNICFVLNYLCSWCA